MSGRSAHPRKASREGKPLHTEKTKDGEEQPSPLWQGVKEQQDVTVCLKFPCIFGHGWCEATVDSAGSGSGRAVRFSHESDRAVDDGENRRRNPGDPVPQYHEDFVEVIADIPQERISERMLEPIKEKT